MSLRTAANRYAKALFDVAVTENADLATIAGDLSAVSDVIAANTELKLATERAGVPDAARVAVMEQIADRLGVVPQVKKLVAVLTRGRRLELMKDLTDSFHERLLAHQKVVRADVTSAVPLSPDQTRVLEQSLSQATGKKVEITAAVDPALLGGVVARIGSTVYDGSVRTQLSRLRQELVRQ